MGQQAPINQDPASAQIRNNISIGWKISVNLGAVLVAYYALLGISLGALGISEPLFLIISEVILPITVPIITALTVWLSVKSILKKGLIESKNILPISIYSIYLPGIIVILLAVLDIIGRQATIIGIATSIVNTVFFALFIVSLVYYFLSKGRGAKRLVIIVSVIMAVAVLTQGYLSYKQIGADLKIDEFLPSPADVGTLINQGGRTTLPDGSIVSSEWISVSFKSGTSRTTINGIATQVGGTIAAKITNGNNYIKFDSPKTGQEIESVIKTLEQNPNVEAAIPRVF